MKRVPTITILDDSGAQTWTGSLREFFRANDLPAEERAFACGVLRSGDRFCVGGGAAPGFCVLMAEAA